MKTKSKNQESSPNDSPNSSAHMWPMFVLSVADSKISDVFKERPHLKSQFHPFHPVKSASLVSGLLTEPSFHANTLRLELLVHLLLAFAAGNRKPKACQIASWLNSELGSTMFARLEDPVEDVFISNVTTEAGNIRIFEGIWQSSDFYLQRILNVTKTLPDNQNTRQLNREITAVLRLSEEIAVRRKLVRFCPGTGLDKGKIRIPSQEQLELFRSAITFSQDDLKRLRISSSDLVPFTLDISFLNRVGDQMLTDSDIHRRPIAYDDGKWFILLPTVISVAVRQHVLEWMLRSGYKDSFDYHLLLEYKRFLIETPILDTRLPKNAMLPDKRAAGKSLVEFSTEIDTGRYLQVIAVVDGLAGYLNHGLSSPDEDENDLALSDQIIQADENGRSYFSKQEGFKQGLTLIVGCGYGRPYLFGTLEETPDWRIEFLSAPDLQTIAWDSNASPLALWKLVDYKRFLADHSITIVNVNGLLNLYGWWSETNYMMLYPDVEFGGTNPVNIMIPTDSLANIRKKVRLGWDTHVLPLPDGSLVSVHRVTAQDYFTEEEGKTQYACTDAIADRKLLAALIGQRFFWWIETEPDKTVISRDFVFQVWNAVCRWLNRAVPVLEQHTQNLHGQSVIISLDFSSVRDEQVEHAPEHRLASCLSVLVDQQAAKIRISFHDPFFGGFRNPKNIAERTIVEAVVKGVLMLAGKVPGEDSLEPIVNKIIPNDDARYFHIFEATHFRDYIQNYDRPRSLFTDKNDEARSKLGLGWLAQQGKRLSHFTTADKSVPFLNSVVDVIWKRIRAKLHTLDRTGFIERSLRHIEGIEADKRRWSHTIRAVLSLRDDKASAKAVAMQQIARCNAAEIALRLLIEMAVSECPLKGGQRVGILDTSPLMTDAFCMFQHGGCSDAIKKGVMEPEIQIAPNGDILSHIGFRDEVADPLGQQYESVRLDHESSRYERHFETWKLIPTVQGQFQQEFSTAFEAEFGFGIDVLREVRDVLENLAIEKKRCVFVARQEDIVSYCAKSHLTAVGITKAVLHRFSLWPREAWDKTPDGFKNKDWYPWRFGRRLSLVTRPIVRLQTCDNPLYAISPGLFGDGFAFTLSQYYEGTFEASDCISSNMQSWIGKEKYRRGHAFAQEIFAAVQKLGYKAYLEIKLTELLNEQLDRDWGDVDVLAWKPGSDEVFAIECKNLKTAKTPIEMADQLNAFGGQTAANGKRDELLKHLDRCDFLRQRSRRVAETIGVNNTDIRIRAVVCFSKPAPIQFVQKRFPNVSFLIINNLLEIGEILSTTKL